MKITRRQWGWAAAGLASGAITLTGCSSPENEPPPSDTPAVKLSLLERSIVLDLHCDTPMLISAEGYDLGERHDYGQVDIPRMREGGVSGVFFSIYTSATAMPPAAAAKRALEIIDDVVAEVSRHPGDLVLARTSSEITAAKKQGKIAILMGVEGGHMIDSSIEALGVLFNLGVRYMTLTHNGHTPWADCAAQKPVSNGLTDFGREIVREMNRLGMMVDISHVSDATFHDAVETSTAPVIASHSSCRALANRGRNLTDDMLRKLASKGGVAHINYYNGFLDDKHNVYPDRLKHLDERAAAVRKQFAGDRKQCSIELRKIDLERVAQTGRPPFDVLLNHFAHAVKIAGVDHVGMGSDFDGVSEQLPQGMDDISKIPDLVRGLRGRGFGGEDIGKILGANTMRVMREVEHVAAQRAAA